MAVSSKEIEALWNRYSKEGANKGISVAQYFELNGISYRAFEKWYQKKFSKPDIVECVVSEAPVSVPQVTSEATASLTEQSKSPKPKGIAISFVSIGLNNGMKIEHHRLSYEELVSFINKLQSLCSA